MMGIFQPRAGGTSFTAAPPAGMGLPVITGKFTDAELADIPTRRDSVG